MKIIVTSQYGTLSRGRHSARCNGSWASKDEYGNLVIDAPGTWLLHCADGFNRAARATLVVKVDGSYTMTGETKRFTVVECSASDL